MAARHGSKPVRLLEQAMSARYTSEHVRNFLAHSGLVHYVVRDVAPIGDGGYVVYYDEAALEGVEGAMLADLLLGGNASGRLGAGGCGGLTPDAPPELSLLPPLRIFHPPQPPEDR